MSKDIYGRFNRLLKSNDNKFINNNVINKQVDIFTLNDMINKRNKLINNFINLKKHQQLK